jgi:hypothetical protein
VSVAIVKNLVVSQIVDEAPEQLADDEISVSIDGLDPQPQVGWRIVGPDLLPPQVTIARPQGVSYTEYVNSKLIDFSISERRVWAEGLIERMKKLNIENGLGIAQSLWVHERLRKMQITVSEGHAAAFPPLAPVVGMSFDIDLLNLVITGDIETAFAVLICCTPDDMSEPYHALSAEMIGWILGEIASYLGWA